MDKDMVLEPPLTDEGMVRNPPDVDPAIIQLPPGTAGTPGGLSEDGQVFRNMTEQIDGVKGGAVPGNKGSSVKQADGSNPRTATQLEHRQVGAPSENPSSSSVSLAPPAPQSDLMASQQCDNSISENLKSLVLMEAPFIKESRSNPTDSSPVPPEGLADKSLPSVDTIRSAAARLLVFGFRGKIMNGHARRMISLGAGGVIIFSRNFEDPEQVAQLCADLKRAAAPRPLVTMVDQEGGGVLRLGPPFTAVPWARVIGSTGDTHAAAAAGSIFGRELRAVHIDMDLAPVVDVDTNPANPVIGERSLGLDPELVGEMGYAFVRGLQREGVAACAKHFPGHGDTCVDSHIDLPYLSHTMDRLESVELPPFKHMVDADVAAVMVAHMAAPALDTWRGGSSGRDSEGRDEISSFAIEGMGDSKDPHVTCQPTSMSPSTIRYLRHKLNFEGVVVSDCLEMGAIMKHYTASEAAVSAMQAGVDLLLFCHTESRQVSAVEGLVSAVLKGALPYGRLVDAGKRIDELAKLFVQPASSVNSKFDEEFHRKQLDVVGCKEHQDLVANIQHQAAVVQSQMEARKNIWI